MQYVMQLICIIQRVHSPIVLLVAPANNKRSFCQNNIAQQNKPPPNNKYQKGTLCRKIKKNHSNQATQTYRYT